MRWTRMRIPSFLVFVFFLVLVFSLVSCGGGEEADFALSVFPEPTPFPFDGDGLYVGSEHRLVFPTFTPVPTSTPRPTRVALSRKIGVLALTPAPTLALALAVLVDPPDGGVVSCVDHYRRMLIDYEGRIKFGPEVVGELSEDMKEVRPDCVIEGWAPEFGLETVCRGTRIGQVRVIDVFFRWVGNRESRPIARSTMRDDRGNILVHFQRMPFYEGRGCWYYDSGSLSWAWLLVGESSPRVGIDRPQFPGCEKHLRNLVDESSVENPSALDIARLIDRVKLDAPSECGDLWSIYPQRGARDDCEVSAPTGLWDDGSGDMSVVINWHLDYPASDGSVCWIRPVVGGEWHLLHPVQAEGVLENGTREVATPEVDLVRARDNPGTVEPPEDGSLTMAESPHGSPTPDVIEPPGAAGGGG